MSNPDANLNEVILRINETVKTRLDQTNKTKLTDAAQEEIGKVINLIQRIEQAVLLLEQKKADRKSTVQDLTHKDESLGVQEEKLSSILKYLEIAVYGLCQNPPNLVFSKNIRRKIRASFDNKEYGLMGRILNFGRGIIYLSSAPAKVLLGLMIALPIYVTTPILLYKEIPQIANVTFFKQKTENEIIDYQQNLSLLVLAGLAGGLGSIISILTRIKQYDSPEYTDSFLPLVIGVFKPIIGAAFGILIVAIIHSDFLPLNVKKDPPGAKEYFFFSIAFIIGFSERFALDIVSRTENAITGSSATSDTKEEKT
jgi:hypothetical protein